METIINSNVTVGVTQVTVLEENSNRRYGAFCNDSAYIMYISIAGDAEVGKGIRLNANGGTFEINKENLIRSKITAISTGGPANLSFVTIE